MHASKYRQILSLLAPFATALSTLLLYVRALIQPFSFVHRL